MLKARDYFYEAQENEMVFRNILNHILENQVGHKSLSLEKIYETFSKGERHGLFTILDFRVGPFESSHLKLRNNEALIEIENISTLSGKGILLKYKVDVDNCVTLASYINCWIS